MGNDLHDALMARLDRIEDKIDTLTIGLANQTKDHAVLSTVVSHQNTRLKKLESRDFTWFLGVVISMATIAVGLSQVIRRLGF